MNANRMPAPALPRHFDLCITLTAPFNTAASEPSRLGIDSPLLRDHRRRICLPGTLLQGRVFEEVGNWASFPELQKRLGDTASSASLQPNRKGLIFGDLVVTDPQRSQTTTFVRIGMDKDGKGAVDPGALQVIELPAGSGTHLVFQGYVLAVCSDSEAQSLAKELLGALRLVPTFGADRSVGFGVVHSVDVTLRPALAPAPLAWPGDTTAVDLAVTLDRPFLVTESSPRDNLFIGSEIIPGNAIKGAFADTCIALGCPLPTGFDDIVFRHALCRLGEHRPRALPASLAQFKRGKNDEVAIDLADQDGAVVLGKGDALAAPQFAVDWKDPPRPPYAKFNATTQVSLKQHFGWATPSRELRVRTAIESATRAAADAQLFAYEQVIHEENRGGSDAPNWQSHVWTTRIDISALAPNEQINARIQILEVFRYGLVGLGKTRAHVNVVAISAHNRAPAKLQAGGRLYLTLQTPALLSKPGSLSEGADSQALFDAYADTIRELSGGSLTLSHFYARQTLRGGYYQQQRFKQNNARYEPWLMTNAGSVFVLTIANAEQASKSLDQWEQRGLPIPPAWDGKFADWRTNPYLPQNGFGEIAVNYPEHKAWSPEAQGIAVIAV